MSYSNKFLRQLRSEALLEYLKTKIEALRDASKVKDSNMFVNIVKDIQIGISELGKPLGVEISGFPKLTSKAIHLDISQEESSIIKHKISSLFNTVEDHYFSFRTTNCLKSQNINNIGDLVQKTESELLGIRNFGKNCLREVTGELSQMGLHLGMQIPSWPAENDDQLIEYFYQINKEESQIQIKQGQKENLRNKTVQVTEKQFISLLRRVDEFELSFRAAKCLKRVEIIYIGDLVHNKRSDILANKNIGRISLLKIHKILNEMNLDFGMNILGWPPKNIDKALEEFNQELEQLRIEDAKKLQRNLNIEYLEDELSHLANIIGTARNAQIIVNHFGFEGKKPKTLEAVGKEFNITRERVRQICLKFEKKVRSKKSRKQLYMPILDSILNFISSKLPNDADYIESQLINIGLTKATFSSESLLKAIKIFRLKDKFSIIRLRRKRFLVKPGCEKDIRLLLQLAKKSIEHWGVATCSDIASQAGETTKRPIDPDFVKIVLSSLKEFHFLDEMEGWFWISSTARNRLLNQIRKILSISGQIDIAELRAGVGRSHRMEGFAPPRRVLLELCRQISWCKINGNMVIADPPLNWEETLAGSSEWAIAATLKEYGPVMSRIKLEEMCLDLGMNQHTFSVYLSFSPIITKYAIGVYGLRGSKISPSVIESLKPKKEYKKVLLDFGWTDDGKIWICHEISQAMIKTGVLNIPAAMMKFIKGNFQLRAADGAYLGNVKVVNSSGWGFSAFFQRRGGEPGDYLVLTFDVNSHEAKAYIGDESLLDIFTPEEEA